MILIWLSIWFPAAASAAAAAADLSPPPCRPVDFTEPAPATVTREGCFFAEATRGSVNYEVTFPAGYEPGRRLPYAIFLHGRGSSEKQFRAADGEAALTRYGREGGAPFLVVAPAAARPCYWKDGADDSFGCARLVTRDLIAHLEGRPGVGAHGREGRGVFGISMGAHGALYLSQLKENLFTAVYAISPVFRGPDELLPEDVAAFGRGADYERQDPAAIYRRRKASGLPGFPLAATRAEMGRHDEFLRKSPHTKTFLREWRRDAGSLRVNLSRRGGHELSYWRGAVARAIAYLGANLARSTPQAGAASEVPSPRTRLASRTGLNRFPSRAGSPFSERK